MFVVYRNDNGHAVSIGSTVADPLPAGLTAVELSGADALALSNGTGRWDPATRTVVPLPPDPFVVNEGIIRTEVEAARQTNNTALTSLTAARTILGNGPTGLVTTLNAIIAAPVSNVSNAAARIDELANEMKRLVNVVDGAVVQLGATSQQLNKVGRLILGQFDATT